MKNILIAMLFISSHYINAQEKQDWANLKKYQSENSKLMNEREKNISVVFMGNSITEGWLRADSSFFINNGFINRGISGQVTAQMLVRFRADVIELRPKAVVILAGINDIAENQGSVTLEEILGNISSMAELAKSNGIKVILCSVLPANRFTWRPALQPAEKVIKLNEMIKGYALKQGHAYVDYFSAMVDADNGLKKMYGEDGVHPNLVGYKVMEPLLQKEITKALKLKK